MADVSSYPKQPEEPAEPSERKKFIMRTLHILFHIVFIAYFIWATIVYKTYGMLSSELIITATPIENRCSRRLRLHKVGIFSISTNSQFDMAIFFHLSVWKFKSQKVLGQSMLLTVCLPIACTLSFKMN